MKVRLSPFLTPAAHRMLKQMRDGEDNYAISEGIQVWVDLERFSYQTLMVLLRSCLISMDSSSSWESGQTQIWFLNEEGRKIIDDPDYVPLYWREMKKRAEQERSNTRRTS